MTDEQLLTHPDKDRYSSTRDILIDKPLSATSNRLLVDIAREVNGNVSMAARGDPPEPRI
jgi:hypothetical protein